MKITLKLFVILVFCGLIAGQGCGTADVSESGGAEVTPEIREDGTQIYQVEGTVKGINKAANEVVIEHGEIPGLMSAMRMDFKVSDPAMLDEVAAGDRIDFELERSGSELTVTKMINKSSTETPEGARIFKDNCAKCHGENGQGTEKGISFVEGHALDHPREDFIKQVRNGEEDKMPAFDDKLSDAEIEAVVDYVRNVIQKDATRDGAGSHDH